VKRILFTLLLSGLGLWAQTPPQFPATPPPSPGTPPPSPAVPAPARNLPARSIRGPASATTNAPAASPATVPGTPTPPGQAPRSGPPGPGTPGAVRPAVPASAPGATLKGAPKPGEANPAAEETTVPAGMIDFRKADFAQVLTVYAELVNRTILRPTSLPEPQINLTTRTALTQSEAIQALDAVLGLNGIAMVNVGDKFVKAVPIATAGGVGQAVFKGNGELLPELGQYVTYVMQVTNVAPKDLVQALQPFASVGPVNGILPIGESQTLVLRDFSENVKRMVEMVKKIDVPIKTDFVNDVIPIKYAQASEIAGALNSLSGTGAGGGSIGGGMGMGGRGGMGMGMGRGMGNRTGMGMGMGGGYGGMGMGGGYGTGLGGYTPMAAMTPGVGNSFTDRLRGIMQNAGMGGATNIHVLGQTKIIADERTNSLLIYATKEDMEKIKDIISKLDIVLAQVLIESVIIEVDLNKSRDLGVSYQEAKGHGIGNYFNGQGVINNNNIISPSTFLSGSATNAAGSLPGGFSYLAHLGQDLDVTVTAAATDSRAKIIQRPRVQASHGVNATLFVGETTPYPTGTSYGGAFGGYSSIQQMQVGVTLSVTPLINPDGLVVMEIQQQIDSISGSVAIANIGNVPITSSKTASTTVAVRDHDTIILGGLIETSKNNSHSGVPVLMDIPLLGYLFRSSSKTDARTELIVLIRPTVLPTPEVAALAARAEKNKMPGVREAEHEIQTDENRMLRKFDKDHQGKEILETQ